MAEFQKGGNVEFTGERVIPELVDADLLNEHLARYIFANSIAAGLGNAPHVLDAGCGSGYGIAELSCAASVTAADISAEAIAYARRRYGRPNVNFVQAACEALPFASAQFDMVTTFEVIEHIERWRDVVAEASRVLRPSGILLVSTPNRDYYAESRGDAGPNPFHRHEFDYAGFRDALTAVFPHVYIRTQNHAEVIAFSPQDDGAGNPPTLIASGRQNTASAHFYLAVCSHSPVDAGGTFAWLPSRGNVLQERERHIAKLRGEMDKKDAWLQQNIDAHSALQRDHEALLAELGRQNEWAAGLDRELAVRNSRIDELQNEQAGRLTWIADLELRLALREARIGELQDEQAARLAWIGDLESQIARARTEIDRLNEEAVNLQSETAERTLWAQRLDDELGHCRNEVEHCRTDIERGLAEIERQRRELHRIAASRWVRAGAKLGLCPRVCDGQ